MSNMEVSLRQRLFDHHYKNNPDFRAGVKKLRKDIRIVRVLATTHTDLKNRGWDKSASWDDVRAGGPASMYHLLNFNCLSRFDPERKEEFEILYDATQDYIHQAMKQRSRSKQRDIRKWEQERATANIIMDTLHIAFQAAVEELLIVDRKTALVYRQIDVKSHQERETNNAT